MGLWKRNTIRVRRVKKPEPPNIVESLRLRESIVYDNSQSTPISESIIMTDELVYDNSQSTPISESIELSESITFTNL